MQPSKRVMACMVSLPDGTFMIMNGAHHGVAGFGLADDPNLNAVLYDPTQPLGSRFSILNNTIVARMYHSEATLLPDGRILVSGSDPQTNNDDGTVRYPEEFRIEVCPHHLALFLLRIYFFQGIHSTVPQPRVQAANLLSPRQRLGIRPTIQHYHRTSIPGYKRQLARFTRCRHLKHSRKHHGCPHNFPCLHLCRNDVHHHSTTQCWCFPSRLASAFRSRWANPVTLPVGANWWRPVTVGQLAQLAWFHSPRPLTPHRLYLPQLFVSRTRQ